MIAEWSSGAAEDYMDEAILTDLAPIVARHPWWTARASLTIALMHRLGLDPPARVLDAGCGWGVTLSALEGRGYVATGLDVSRSALVRLDAPHRRLIEADLTRPWPGDAGLFAAVLALDVIEHLDDDREAVSRLSERVAPGGALIVSVPALPELFSEFDAIQGHRRRYRPDTLRAAFDGSGLRLDRVFWWGEWLVERLRKSRRRPLAAPGESAAFTYRRHLRVPPWPLPWLLRGLFALEERRALGGRSRVGTSLFAVARRDRG